MKLLFVIAATLVFASPVASSKSIADEDPHAHHRAMMQDMRNYSKSYSEHDLPTWSLKNQFDIDVNTREIFNGETPIILSFIFTTCTTICPVLTATLSSAQNKLMSSSVKPLLVSISIDPEVDTPDKLMAYSEKFKATENWIFLTGDLNDIIEIQRALNVYRGSKLNHEPVTLIKAKNKKWLTLKGFTSANDLVNEYRSYILND